MKKLLRSALPVLLIALCFGAVSVTETKAQVINDILRRMDNNYKSLTTLRSNLKMVQYQAQIKMSDTYEGTVSFIPKDKNKNNKMYVRIDWAKPLVENIAIVGDKYTIYRPKLNQFMIGSTSAAQKGKVPSGSMAFLSMSKTQLKENYQIEYIGQEQISGAIDTWHLHLTPKNAAGYKSADLWVDSDGMPRQAMITENNSDTSTILLHGFEKNASLKGSDFDIKIPKGAKKVQA